MQLSSWNGVIKSNSQIYCCHERVALSKAYNYYQRRELSGAWFQVLVFIRSCVDIMRAFTDSCVLYSGVTLNVARPDMNNYATLGVMLY